MSKLPNPYDDTGWVESVVVGSGARDCALMSRSGVMSDCNACLDLPGGYRVCSLCAGYRAGPASGSSAGCALKCTPRGDQCSNKSCPRIGTP
jgi:hypothetical protein